MLGFQGGVSIPLVKGGVKAPPAKRQCRAGPKAGARRGFTPGGAPRVADRGESAGRAGTRRPYQSGHNATLHRGGYRGQAQARRAPVCRVLYGAPCGDAHQVPATRASSGAGCKGGVADRLDEQRDRRLGLRRTQGPEVWAQAQRCRQVPWAWPTRQVAVHKASRSCSLLALGHPLPAHHLSVVVAS
jgi:hypothetical protein